MYLLCCYVYDVVACLSWQVQEEVVASAVRAIILLGMSDARVISRSAIRKSITVENRAMYATPVLPLSFLSCSAMICLGILRVCLTASARSVDTVLDLALKRVQAIFGMDLCYLTKPPPKPKKGKGGAATSSEKAGETSLDTSTYLLVNRLTHPDHMRYGCET